MWPLVNSPWSMNGPTPMWMCAVQKKTPLSQILPEPPNFPTHPNLLRVDISS